MPAELGGLTALETLKLFANDLTSVPTELGRLAALKVGRCRLTASKPELKARLVSAISA